MYILCTSCVYPQVWKRRDQKYPTVTFWDILVCACTWLGYGDDCFGIPFHPAFPFFSPRSCLLSRLSWWCTCVWQIQDLHCPAVLPFLSRRKRLLFFFSPLLPVD